MNGKTAVLTSTEKINRFTIEFASRIKILVYVIAYSAGWDLYRLSDTKEVGSNRDRSHSGNIPHLVRTDVSEELSASFIRVTRIGELGATLCKI
jgi:hypothetical protein